MASSEIIRSLLFRFPFLYASNLALSLPKKSPTHSKNSNGPDLEFIFSNLLKSTLKLPLTSPHTKLFILHKLQNGAKEIGLVRSNFEIVFDSVFSKLTFSVCRPL